MSKWKVEIAQHFGQELMKWDLAGQRELQTIILRLENEGPGGVGLFASELEGFPAWDQLGQPYEREVFVPMRSALYLLVMDIQPRLRILVLSAARTAVH